MSENDNMPMLCPQPNDFQFTFTVSKTLKKQKTFQFEKQEIENYTIFLKKMIQLLIADYADCISADWLSNQQIITANLYVLWYVGMDMLTIHQYCSACKCGGVAGESEVHPGHEPTYRNK